MIKTVALILKKQNIGETDRILTIFSPSLGKKRVVARSIRKPLSRLSGHLDTMMLSQLILTDSNDLPKITSAVLIESFEPVRLNLVKLNRAFSITKIIERVIIEDAPQQSVFQITLDGIARLNDDLPWLNVWLFFLASLTRILGISVKPDRCENCQKHLKGEGYSLRDEPVFYCQECALKVNGCYKIEPNSLKLLYLLAVKPYDAVGKIAIPLVIAREVERILLCRVTDTINKPWSHYSAIGEMV